MDLKVMLFIDLLNVEFIECVVKCGEGVFDKNGVFVVEIGKWIGCFLNDRFIVKELIIENDIDWGKVNKFFDVDKFDVLWDCVEVYLFI